MSSLTAQTLVSTLLRTPRRGPPPCNSPGTAAWQMEREDAARHPQVIARPHPSVVSISSALAMAGRGPAEAGLDANAAIRWHHCHCHHTQPDCPQVPGGAGREPQHLAKSLLQSAPSPPFPRLQGHATFSAHPLRTSPTAASVYLLGPPPLPASPGCQGWYLIHPCGQSQARSVREGAHRGLLHE